MIKLPANWILTEIGSIAQLIMGQSPPSTTYNFDNIGLPFFQGKAEFTNMNPVAVKWCSKPKKIAEINDVLISVRAPVGSVNIADQKSCIGRGLAAVRYTHCFKYLFYFFQFNEKVIDAMGTGSTFRAISKEQLSRYNINLPPINEQHRIVAKIEELFTKLDAAVAELKNVKKQLKRYRQSVLKAAFEGKLTEEWRDKNLIKENNNDLFFQIKKDKLSRETSNKMFEIPNVWSWTDIRSISIKIHYGYTASSNLEEVGPKLLRITDIQNNKVSWNEVPYCQIENEQKDKYLLKEGDFVFARTGATVGKSFLILGEIPEAVFASYLIRIKINTKVNNKYVSYFFNTLSYWQQISEGQVGIGQPNVNAQVLSRILLPLTNLEEQKQIVEEIESRFSIVDKIEEVIDQNLKMTESLRQSILKKAFEGKLVPQDPNDEPAEKLLERIKAEKEKTIASNIKSPRKIEKLK